MVASMLPTRDLAWCAGLVALSMVCNYLSHDWAVFTVKGFKIASQIWMAIFGIQSYLMMYNLYRMSKDEKVKKEGATPALKGEWPPVTVQLPIFNERFVVERLVRKVIQLDYPGDKLEIQVLDDSTDGSDEMVSKLCAELQKETGCTLTHITRTNRVGYKAGALKAGTMVAKGEFLAIFDADFMPQPEFLKTIIPHFQSNKVGCVQARWGHLNYDHSLFTKLQAIGHDAHFVVEQHTKSHSNWLLNFNGTAGVWRKKAIEDAGHWQGDCLAEDLDLSYRCQMKGWRIKYIRDLEVPAELPVSVTAFKKQQYRWAKGSMQAAVKLTGQVWACEILSVWQKVVATVHLLGYSMHPMLVINLTATLFLFFADPHAIADPVQTAIFLLPAMGPPLVVGLGQLQLKHYERLLLLPCLVVLHAGMCLSNTKAVVAALRGEKSSFERTPKFGETSWAGTNYANNLKINLPWPELIACAGLILSMFIGCFVDCLVGFYPFLALSALGFAAVAFLHLDEVRQQQNAIKQAQASTQQKKKVVKED